MPALVGYNSVAASVFLMRKRSIAGVHIMLTLGSKDKQDKNKVVGSIIQSGPKEGKINWTTGIKKSRLCSYCFTLCANSN